ncbi:fructosamine kinase family protein [Flavobacteriaceae bacterium XHP0103]|uniref:fructosamine kinase family protein n=1 Tax=Marixanthotalea marina TaxID=2844359 RepID=UPI002989FA56|nr:fructosamine kinase family protein [Marixanthotalea marina]MBU3821733.1 fructosamine kinase family protein [Marixanthotalea marina]
MNSEFQEYISNLLNENVTKINSVSGGDISEAFKIRTSKNAYFLKTNQASTLNMFQTEAAALKHINDTKTIKTPKVIAVDTFKNNAFLLMEFIESKTPTNSDFETLGFQLAALHSHSVDYFGWEQDNFIGTLPQSNTLHKSWADFYVNERLQPQLRLARQSNLLSGNECPPTEKMLQALQPMFQNTKPSLLHGDLWGGNYIISKSGEPYLIDPAMYYGHSEVDIAMTKLFGGFGDNFYKAYHSVHPEDAHTTSRIDVYQLYYLLVHLNLFGNSYYGSVSRILQKYF